MKEPKKTIRRIWGGAWLMLSLVLLVSCVASRCGHSGDAMQGSTGSTYTTNFPSTENPISEGGKWINGRAAGLDWSDVATVPGLAYGTESGTSGYDDSTVVLTGTWGSDQMAEATVHTVNQNDNIYEEVELRLRSSLSAHKATGYEINFRCSKTANAYAQIVRWNGPLGNFTYVDSRSDSKYGVANGDVVKATIVGNVITAYINGAQVLQATDNTYTTGSPGMGFFLQGTTGVNRDYGFTSFTASDESQRVGAGILDRTFHYRRGMIFSGVSMAAIGVLLWVMRRRGFRHGTTVASYVRLRYLQKL